MAIMPNPISKLYILFASFAIEIASVMPLSQSSHAYFNIDDRMDISSDQMWITSENYDRLSEIDKCKMLISLVIAKPVSQ
jgi:hypothetical protein